MKRMHLILQIMLALLLAVAVTACAPAVGNEPESAPLEAPAEGEEAGSGLATVAPQDAPGEPGTPTAEEATEMQEAAEPAGNEEAQETESGQAVEHGAVTPAVVDLRAITPEPPQEDATPRVIHAPGIPNPSAAASNRAAIDLADSLSIDAEEVEIVSVEAVEWRDSSLGCPKPGQNYLSVITPGFRVLLKALGEQFEYHTNQDGTIVRQCQGGAGNPVNSVDR